MDSDLRKEYGINVVSIQRGTRRINIPKGETRIFPGDTIGVIGTDDQIQSLLTVVEGSESPEEETDNKGSHIYACCCSREFAVDRANELVVEHS